MLPTPSPNILDALSCAFLFLPQFPCWRLLAVSRVFQFKCLLALHPNGAFPNGAKKEEVLTMAMLTEMVATLHICLFTEALAIIIESHLFT